MTDYESTLLWLIVMAKDPGFKDHAWWRAKQLAADDSGLWAGMDKALADAMKPANSGCARHVPASPTAVAARSRLPGFSDEKGGPRG